MPRKPDFDTLDEVIHYHIGMWYASMERDPSLGADVESRYQEAQTVDQSYREYLQRFRKEWVSEESLERVRINLEYLTKVFSTYEGKKALLEKQARLAGVTFQKLADRKRLSEAIRNNQ